MQIVTANRLTDGRVVFREADGRWGRTLAAAALLDAAAVAEALAAAARDVAERLVVEPYAIDVVTTAAGPQPKTMRERIRATGPGSGSEVAAASPLTRAA